MKKTKNLDPDSSSMARAPQPDSPRREWLDAGVGFALRFRRFIWDITGVVLLIVGSTTLLALIGSPSGAWVTPWALLLRRWLGWGSIILVLVFGASGLVMLSKRQKNIPPSSWWRVIALEISIFSLLALLAVTGDLSLERAEAGADGGLVGWGIAKFGILLLTSIFPIGIASWILTLGLIALMVYGAVFGLGQNQRMGAWLQHKLEGQANFLDEGLVSSSAISVSPVNQPVSGQEDIKGAKKRSAPYIPPEHRKQFKVDEDSIPEIAIRPRDNFLPPLDLLLQERPVRPSNHHINMTAGLIEKTLAEFGVPAKVVGFQVGPTVTQYAIEPGYQHKGEENDGKNGQKVRVSQISALQRDLALALSAERIRIQAPVPGRSFVGIEVPNARSDVVRLRSILETEEFYKVNSPLTVALGRDVSGHVVVADLAKMPHLLIAGTTGSGKSVCVAALAVCLMMNNTPEDLRLVMIDPKMVEMVPFNGLPHLFGKVETNLDRIAVVLRWIVFEMERRYKLLEELRSRDLEGYNRKARRRSEYETMPRIVVLIDELADLMMSSAEQTETTLVRLAQMARATGIHLIVATQRPSTDVVTGLIKANFPARISFAVASGVDSRVILDGPGAESLLGRGDMLYLAPEAAAPLRSQGVMVSDKEIENIIAFWQKTWESDESPESPWDEMAASEEYLPDRDELTERAIALVQETGRASASHLQRSLRIGYPRAARLMDELEDLGIVGPSQGGGRERDVLIDFEDDDEYHD